MKVKVVLKNCEMFTTRDQCENMVDLFRSIENSHQFVRIGKVIVDKSDISYVVQLKDDN